jgi:hypothetical protein
MCTTKQDSLFALWMAMFRQGSDSGYVVAKLEPAILRKKQARSPCTPTTEMKHRHV